MKRNDVVDIETAHKLFSTVCTLPRIDARMVIWPEEKANDALEAWADGGPEQLPLCHRRLFHLVCLENEIRCFLSMPRADWKTPADYGINVYVVYVPYDFSPGETTFGIAVHFVILGPGQERLVDLPHNKQMIEAGEITVYKNVRDFRRAPENDIRAFQLVHILEHYAFSPCATIKQRPRLIKAINQGKPPDPLQQREWPAIEIVSLRRPEITKRPGHTGAGHKIGVRYSVTEHLRRQPTKAGVKLITIGEHWRGPKDAPVKPKVEKIYKVTR